MPSASVRNKIIKTVTITSFFLLDVKPTSLLAHQFGHECILPVRGESSSTVMQDAVVVISDAEVRHRERVVFAKVMSSRCNINISIYEL